MGEWKFSDFLMWNTLRPVLSCIQQNCSGPEDDVHNLEEYLQIAPKQKAVFQVAYSKNRHRGTERKHHESFNVRNREKTAYFHTKAANEFGYPLELYQSLYQMPEYMIDFKGRQEEFEDHIVHNINWINFKLYTTAFEKLGYEESFDNTIDGMVDERFSWLTGEKGDEMRGILRGYLKQKPQRMLFLIDIEPVNTKNPNDIYDDPAYYFHWLEPAHEIILEAMNNLGMGHATVVTGKGYHIMTEIPLYENEQYNTAMFNLMKIGGILQEETVARLVHTYMGSRKTFPVPLLAEKAHRGIYKLMQYLLVNLVEKIRYRMGDWGFPHFLSFCDDGDYLVSMDMTAMLNPVDRRDFGIPGQIYGKTQDYPIVRIVREINNYDYFGKGYATNPEMLERIFQTRSNLDEALAHIIKTGARIPQSSSSGINNLIQKYLGSRIKRELHDPAEMPMDSQEVQHLQRSNYYIVRKLCPHLNQFLDSPDSDIFLNPKSLSYFYQELYKKGFSTREQLHITYAIYQDPLKHVNIPKKYCKAEWAAWPVLLKGYHYRD